MAHFGKALFRDPAPRSFLVLDVSLRPNTAESPGSRALSPQPGSPAAPQFQPQNLRRAARFTPQQEASLSHPIGQGSRSIRNSPIRLVKGFKSTLQPEVMSPEVCWSILGKHSSRNPSAQQLPGTGARTPGYSRNHRRPKTSDHIQVHPTQYGSAAHDSAAHRSRSWRKSQNIKRRPGSPHSKKLRLSRPIGQMI